MCRLALPLLALMTVASQLHAELPLPARSALAAAAARGDAAAQSTLSELTLEGELPGDLEAARTTLETRARNGDTRAAYVLGARAYQASPRDRTSALAWWRRAADGGLADAQYNLGLLLARDGAPTEEADRNFEAAARQQHVLACFALGTRLAARDAAGALPWLECAARQGYAPAQFNLAAVLARPPRSEARLVEARRWYAAAAPSFAPAASALAALPAPIPMSAYRPAITDTPTSDTRAAAVLRDREWVMAQTAHAYTVQIASGASAEVLTALLTRELRDTEVACVLERPDSRQPYSAIVGVYGDRESASQALATLPASLRANTPWIRRFGTLQQALRAADKLGLEPPARSD